MIFSLFHLSNSHITPFRTLTFASSSRPKPQRKAPKLTSTPIPARDRVIDFGKHKGRMLGTLSSTYLKWVSKNLRARDFEEWANLADQVLQDPVYKDRIEWEFAENLLNGNRVSSLNGEDAVSGLLELSERFGWDNDDKDGWKRVNFELLGTSKGGRIPRVSGEGIEKEITKGREKARVLSGGEASRKERRERMKMKRKENGDEDTLKNGMKVDEIVGRVQSGEGISKKDETGNYNPFPGRESLLRKVMNRGRIL